MVFKNVKNLLIQFYDYKDFGATKKMFLILNSGKISIGESWLDDRFSSSVALVAYRDISQG